MPANFEIEALKAQAVAARSYVLKKIKINNKEFKGIDIAILSLSGIVNSSSIKIAGNTFDSDIMKYIKDKYKLLIKDRTTEEIKLKIGNVFEDKNSKNKIDVRDRNLVTGLSHTIIISEEEITKALLDSAMIIVHTVKTVLVQTPPKLSADIIDNGIVLTG